MSNEIRLTTSLQNGTNYRGVGPTSFNANQEGTFFGPYPGATQVSVSGTDIDLSKFSRTGLMEIWNQDATNWVEYGIYEPDTNVFYPLGEVGPGERYVLKLSRNIGEQTASWFTGTGTSPTNNTLRLKADTAECNVFVGIFNR